jgi:predicted nuclease with TOPRIM domain
MAAKEYSDDLCKERHKTINEKFTTQDLRLNNHAERLDTLEQHRSRVEVQIENLIDKIDLLITQTDKLIKYRMKTLFVLGTTGLGFIIWYIQQL